MAKLVILWTRKGHDQCLPNMKYMGSHIWKQVVVLWREWSTQSFIPLLFLSEHSVNKISQWRHININGSQITDELIVRSTAWSGYEYKNINSPVLLPFVRGIHRWLVDGYPLVFSYHDVIMYTRLSFFTGASRLYQKGRMIARRNSSWPINVSST